MGMLLEGGEGGVVDAGGVGGAPRRGEVSEHSLLTSWLYKNL